MNIVNSIATTDRTLLERAFEQRCKTVYLGKHVALTRVLGDLLLYVDTRDLILAPHLVMNGCWEFWVTQAIARHLKPGMVCADVGANVGYYTLLMAALVGPKGRVHAFDLLPDHCRLVTRSAEVNGFRGTVTVHQGAVAEQDGEARIHVPQSADAFAHLGNAALAGVNTRQPTDETMQPGVVPCRKLDSVDFWPVGTPCSDRRLDFIKVDVEGAEPLVWEGALAVRDTYRPVICMEYEAWRQGYPEFLTRVREHGYRVRYVEYDSSLAELPKEPDPERLYMLWVTK